MHKWWLTTEKIKSQQVKELTENIKVSNVVEFMKYYKYPISEKQVRCAINMSAEDLLDCDRRSVTLAMDFMHLLSYLDEAQKNDEHLSCRFLEQMSYVFPVMRLDRKQLEGDSSSVVKLISVFSRLYTGKPSVENAALLFYHLLNAGIFQEFDMVLSNIIMNYYLVSIDLNPVVLVKENNLESLQDALYVYQSTNSMSYLIRMIVDKITISYPNFNNPTPKQISKARSMAPLALRNLTDDQIWSCVGGLVDKNEENEE